MKRLAGLGLLAVCLTLVPGCGLARNIVRAALDSQEKIEEFILKGIDKGSEELKEEVPDLTDRGLSALGELFGIKSDETPKAKAQPEADAPAK